MNDLESSIASVAGDASKPVRVETTVMVVEDDDDVRALVTELLGTKGYRIIAVPDADRARDVLNSGEPIDLLFTDIVMPGPMNGAELAQWALRVRPALKVLFTSGYVGYPAPRLPAMRMSGNFIEKPYRPSKLIERVEAMLRS